MRLRFSVLACTILCASVVLFCATAASAQFRAAIQGTVTDPQGAAVVGATVTLTNKETNKAQQTTSSDEGTYRFDRLAPGHYAISAEAATFKRKVLEDAGMLL
ncbi:MAG: carboxypeptidase-like regulatory domain-containing protein [Pyrinomonadaceae bacterium]